MYSGWSKYLSGRCLLMERMRILPLFFLWVALASTLGQAAHDPTAPYLGQWIGEAETQLESTRLVLDINSIDGELSAKMTLLDVGVMGWPSKRVQRVAEELHVVFPSDSGDQTMRFSLNVTKTGEPVLEGTWSDARFEDIANVTLTQAIGEEVLTEQAVNIEGPAGTLSAALILPTGKGPHPGIICLHGSGPQPKDANRFAARALARRGIATLIFDKRGVGKSEGKWAGASFDDLADDGVAAAQYLLSLPEVSSVGFFGHSQGGWIGPLAGTKWEKTAFVISSAGPAVPPSREAQWGFVRKLRSLGVDENEIESARQIIEYWHDGIRTAEWSRLDAAIQAARARPWFEPSGFDHFSRRPNKAFAKNYRAFMDYDPVPTLKRINAPLLAILAPDDESIDSHETDEILTGLIEQGNDIRVKLYPGFDHSIRKLGGQDQLLRWPEHPKDYFSAQAAFIHEVMPSRERD